MCVFVLWTSCLLAKMQYYYKWPFAKKLHHGWLSTMTSSNEISWKLSPPKWRAGCAPAWTWSSIAGIRSSCVIKWLKKNAVSPVREKLFNVYFILQRNSSTKCMSKPFDHSMRKCWYNGSATYIQKNCLCLLFYCPQALPYADREVLGLALQKIKY